MVTWRYQSDSFSEEAFAVNGRFTAVVMNYNKRGMVARAVRSALEQDYPCYEVLAMDDHSTDGSEGEMEAELRSFVAAHPGRALRILLAVNEENLTTLGQWRQAAAISGGQWFGLFGGDDESFPDRLSTAAGIARAHPAAVGICTNYLSAAPFEWERLRGVLVRRPGDLAWPGPPTMLGCTAFWRRSLLELDLPKGCMDDFVLSWIAVISRCGELVWDLDRRTVRYSDGTGVTTADRRGLQTGDFRLVSLWRRYFAVRRRGRRFGRKVWDAIRDFDGKHGSDATISRQVRGLWVASATEGGGWFARLGALWTMLVVDRRNDYGGLRAELVGTVRNRFLGRILGPFSFVALHRVRCGLHRGGANGGR